MKLRYAPRASLQLRAIALGHEGALPGTREFVIPGLPYILVHRIEPSDPETLTVLAVYHGAQLRPGQTASDDDS